MLSADSQQNTPGTLMDESDIRVHYFTHNGGVRINNEDSLLVQHILISDTSMERPASLEIKTGSGRGIFCVADGIGGEQKGEVASRMVLEGLQAEQSLIGAGKTLAEVLYDTKNSLEQYVSENPGAFNLGSTVAGIAILDRNAIIFNVGDCRVYRINGQFFEQVTKDHSIVQALFEEGVITEEEMRRHPRRNVITSSISGDGRPDSIQVFSHDTALRSENTFFICSDGIWGCFSHDELELIYGRYKEFDFCEKLLTAALARRATDNISAILLTISNFE
jgi:protein phosphatase